MEYLPVTDESISKAAEVLRTGGLVAFPTETVYGLGADAFNSMAAAKVFAVKGRPHFDPLIIHIAAADTLQEVTNLSLLSEDAKHRLFLLAENLWPGPLSLVLPKSEKIPGIVTAGLSTAAIRFPAHEAAQKLIALSTGAVAAPSANPFGALSPTKAEHVRDTLGEKIDIILDGGSAQIGMESTVLDLTGEIPRILRPGGTPKEAIENLIGHVEIDSTPAGDTSCLIASPGQLKSHYAPRTPLEVFERELMIRQKYTKDSAYLFFDGSSRDSWLANQSEKPPADVIKVLSQSGNMTEAASRFFETLHEIDSLKVSGIFSQFAPQGGLGEAINDRLKRASNQVTGNR